MAITFVAASSQGGAATVSAALPTGTADGDILIASVFDYKTSAPSITPPGSGWTLIGSNSVTNGKYESYWKRAASEPSSETWTGAASSSIAVAIAAYRGCVTSGSPIGVYSSTAYTTVNTILRAATVTTTSDGNMLVFVGGRQAATGTATPPTGFTERVDYQYSVYALVYIADMSQTTAGATGDIDGALSSSATAKDADLIALLPFTSTTYNQALTLSSTITPLFVRNIGMVKSVSATTTSTARKGLSKVLSNAATSAATLAKGFAVLRTLTANAAGTATLAKARNVVKALSVVCTDVPVVQRVIALTKSVSSVTTSTVRRGISKALSVVCIDTPVLAQMKVKLQSLVATCGSSSTVVRRVGKTLAGSLAGVSTVAQVRAYVRVLSVTSTGTAALQRVIAKTMSLAKSTVSTVGQVFTDNQLVWRSTATLSWYTASTNHSGGSLPAGWQPGDLFLMAVTTVGVGDATCPSGWTQLADVAYTASQGLAVYSRIAQSGDVQPDVVTATSCGQLRIVGAVKNGGTGVCAEVVATATSGAGTSWAWSGVTTAQPNDLIALFGVGTTATTLTLTPPTGYTVQTSNSGPLPNAAIVVATKDHVATGATGTLTGSSTSSFASHSMVTVAVKRTGTILTQLLAVTSSISASVLRGRGYAKVLAAASTAVVSMVRGRGYAKVLLATVASSGTVTSGRAFLKALTVSTAISVVIVRARVYAKVLSVVSGVTGLVGRVLEKLAPRTPKHCPVCGARQVDHYVTRCRVCRFQFRGGRR